LPVPGFGGQLQDHGVFDVPPEATVVTTYETVTGTYADGTPYRIRKPRHTLKDPYQPLPEGVLLSPRLTPPVFGLGLLEAVPESQIVALAANGGHPNYVTDAETGQRKLGRFGWKAATPTLRQQIAAAYQQDMGITNAMFPAEACAGQPQAPKEASTDLDYALYEDNVFYVRSLGAPARRDVGSPAVRQGAQLFRTAQCASCHVPTLTTGADSEIPGLRYQVIHPYTDLLVHDLGEDLADHRPDYQASGKEWRTSPLWGLGLRKRVQGAEPMLHDGRANGAAEAILWHGGEADAARQSFLRMSADERAALIAFLGSL
jgi:CxxC motif-containing protein (DUF1111 family)